MREISSTPILPSEVDSKNNSDSEPLREQRIAARHAFPVEPPSIANVARVFSWGVSDMTLQFLRDKHVDFSRGDFDAAIDYLQSEGKNPYIAQSEIVSRLTEPSFHRILFAPETMRRVQRVRFDPESFRCFLSNALEAEWRLCGHPGDAACWTALGDLYFAAGPGTLSRTATESKWTEESDFENPHTEGGIVLDFTSPHARKTNSHNLSFEEYQPETVVDIVARIRDALQGIGAVSETALLMVNTFVRVIVLRCHTTDHFGSSSSRDYPGRVLLRCPEDASVERISSALIHEAIHQVLYVLEYEGHFARNANREEPLVYSAWTGRKLPLHSYIHACFVWYGLARFWSRALSFGIYGVRRAERELERALSGFHAENPAERLSPFREDILLEAFAGTLSLRNLLLEPPAVLSA